MLNGLELLGLDQPKLTQMREWAAAGKAVTLAFTWTRTCEFDRQETRDIDSKHKTVTESSVFGKSESKVVTTVTEVAAPSPRLLSHPADAWLVLTRTDRSAQCFWKVGARYKICAYPGADEAGQLLLKSREAKPYQLVTPVLPRPLPPSPAPLSTAAATAPAASYCL